MITNQYEEYAPSAALSNLVECYWSAYRVGDQNHSMILPDTCMDIVFNIVDMERGLPSQFVGLMMQASEHVSAAVTEYFGVRFKPLSIIKHLHVDAFELTDVSVDLCVLLGCDAKQLESQIVEARDDQERIRIMESYLIKLTAEHHKEDPVMASALNSISHNMSVVKVNSLAKELFISEKQLQRKFKQTIGTTPKKFIDVLKLRNLTKALRKDESNLDQLIFDYGFFDHSHYLKVMKKYYSKP